MCYLPLLCFVTGLVAPLHGLGLGSQQAEIRVYSRELYDIRCSQASRSAFLRSASRREATNHFSKWSSSISFGPEPGPPLLELCSIRFPVIFWLSSCAFCPVRRLIICMKKHKENVLNSFHSKTSIYWSQSSQVAHWREEVNHENKTICMYSFLRGSSDAFCFVMR